MKSGNLACCLSVFLLSVPALAGETETWYDSRGQAIELAKAPTAPPPFTPQWVEREARRAAGPARRWHGDERWREREYVGWGDAFGWGGYRTWHAPRRVWRCDARGGSGSSFRWTSPGRVMMDLRISRP